ncbi:hypothetical protein L1887_12337 [Cichorium endivia]|nr:hypothetical protein L1887_12337 [Cichorium endivia]
MMLHRGSTVSLLGTTSSLSIGFDLISTLPGTKFSIGGQWRTPFAESSATEHWKVSRYRQIIPHLKVAVICKANLQKGIVPKATSFSVKCQQSSKDGNSLDVWLGRTVMIGFAAAISVEISTGKGLLENFDFSVRFEASILCTSGSKLIKDEPEEFQLSEQVQRRLL